MTKTESATQWMEALANDNTHGYQLGGWGPDYDCSHAVITAWEQAGVPVKTNGATYTGNMRVAFAKCGFKDVTSQVTLSTGAGVQRGDVLLNVTNHTAMSCGNGKIVHARSDNGDSATGDQKGNEIAIQSYFNYPWDCVLRYQESDDDSTPSVSQHTPEPVYVRFGSSGDHARAVQILLNAQYDSETELDEDGQFGVQSYTELNRFQARRGLERDGTCGPATWAELAKL